MNSELMERKTDAYKTGIGRMKEILPEMTEAYHHFTAACFEAGRLDEKQKHLIAIGISIFANNEVCTYYHIQEALSKGATAQEVTETAAVAAAAASGQCLSQGAIRVHGALEEAAETGSYLLM